MIVKIIIIIIIIIITSATRMMIMIMILTTMITQHQFCKIGALKAERRGYFAEFFLREQLYCHFTVYNNFFTDRQSIRNNKNEKCKFNFA